MKIQSERRINALPQEVFAALNDERILRACIPGCESLERTSDTSFDAVMRVVLGPVKARFSGSVRLEDLDPPSGYTLVGEGKGGAAGFAKGKARISLSEVDAGTLLRYDVDVSLGGKLAQLGGRLVSTVSAKYADQFFDSFADHVVGGQPAEHEVESEPDAPDQRVSGHETATEEGGTGLGKRLLWASMGALALLVLGWLIWS